MTILDQLLKRSLLSHLPSAEVARLILPILKTQEIAAGASPERSQIPDQVFIVYSGSIGLFQDGKQIGEVGPGRALEFAILLHKKTQWNFEWRALEKSVIAFFPYATVLSTFRAHPQAETYLRRMVLEPELQKFKHDLNMLGFSSKECRLIIQSFELLPIESTSEKETAFPLALFVVKKGRIRISSSLGEFDSNLTPVFVTPSLSLSFHPVTESSDTAQLWYLDLPSVRGLLAPERLEALQESFKPHWESAVNSGDERSASDSTDPDEADDDGAEWADFQTDQASKHPRLSRLPFVSQHDEMDCGAACLAMVMKYYGKYISLPRLRNLLNVSASGASMNDIATAAQTLGLKSAGFQIELGELNEVKLPAIALLDFHYVVIYFVSREDVYYGDPAVGRLKVPKAEFEKRYSGMTLLFSPTTALANVPEDRGNLLKYAKLFHGHRADLGRISALVTLHFLIGLAVPLFLQFFFDQVLLPRQIGHLQQFLAALVGLMIFRNILAVFRDYFLLHFASRFDVKLSSLFWRHALRLPLPYFNVRRTGDFLSRLQEIQKIRDFFSGRPIVLATNLISFVLFAVVLYFYHPVFPLLLLITLPIYAYLIRHLSDKTQHILNRKFSVSTRTEARYVEHIRQLETIQTQNYGIGMRWRLTAERRAETPVRADANRLNFFSVTLFDVFQELIQMSLFLVAIYLYGQSQISLGQVVAVGAILSEVLHALTDVLKEWHTFTEVHTSFMKVEDVFGADAENIERRSRLTKGSSEEIHGGIELKNIHFRYGGEGSPLILDQINIQIPAGQSLALVGGSGSGKSTLAQMLTSFYTPASGQILFDGLDIADLNLASLRQQIGMVAQDNKVFSGSILENIAFGDPAPDLRQAMAAASVADAHGFISKLPQGYYQILGGGAELSGGERQRLCLARALYHRPKILILDEATSALDPITEARILKNIEKLHREGMTTIMIAHRLNTVFGCDRILVLKNGKIVEDGSHAELASAQGPYSQLIRKQIQV